MESVKGKNDFDGVITGDGYKQSFDDPKKWSKTLVPWTIIRWIAEVLMFGAKKYARGQWMRGMAYSALLDAAYRHMEAFERGEDIDPESGKPHLAHAATNLAFLSWFIAGPDREHYRKFDDRLFIGALRLRQRRLKCGCYEDGSVCDVCVPKCPCNNEPGKACSNCAPVVE